MNRILWNGEADREPERGRPTIDEFVIHDATIHLEQMSDQCYWIGIDTKDGKHLAVNVWARRAHIFCTEQESDIAWDEVSTHDDWKAVDPQPSEPAE